MATRAAFDINRRRETAKQALMSILRATSALTDGSWNAVRTLERIAILCGEQRERDRRKGRGK